MAIPSHLSAGWPRRLALAAINTPINTITANKTISMTPTFWAGCSPSSWERTKTQPSVSSSPLTSQSPIEVLPQKEVGHSSDTYYADNDVEWGSIRVVCNSQRKHENEHD